MLTHISPSSILWDISKQCRFRSASAPEADLNLHCLLISHKMDDGLIWVNIIYSITINKLFSEIQFDGSHSSALSIHILEQT